MLRHLTQFLGGKLKLGIMTFHKTLNAFKQPFFDHNYPLFIYLFILSGSENIILHQLKTKKITIICGADFSPIELEFNLASLGL